jgi:cobalt-zinc-cadmium efflux system membrane fusion protein
MSTSNQFTPSPSPASSSPIRGWLIALVAVGALGAAAWATSGRWLPGATGAKSTEAGHDHGAEGHDEHEGHAHAAGGAETAIKLSANALKNIGFAPVKVTLSNFERKLTLPAIVIEQAGRNQIHVTSPLTGVVTEVLIVPGEAVEPHSAMFKIRLTHEDVVTAQRDYLLNVENVSVVDREIARLEALGEGVIAGKRVLEQKYEKQKLDAALLAGEQSLLMHGLSAEQVADIRKTRKLLQSLTVRSPDHTHEAGGCGGDHLYHVQKIAVSPGEQVEAGRELCVLADHCELLVEGRAFEDDAAALREAVKEGWEVSATLLGGKGKSEKIEGLKLMYLADQIDPETRAFKFYLRLPNQIVLDQVSPTGHRFLEWRYKPGQRLELSVPVEQWTGRIVLPVEAVVEEGAEMYVYRQNGSNFERVPIHVEYRDRKSVVVANDGTLFPGDIVAGNGAYQIHLALKNKSGGAIDPHAGHSH